MAKDKILFLSVLVGLSSVSACTAGTPAPLKMDPRGFAHTTAKKGGSGVNVAYRIEGAAQPNVPARITVELSGVTAQEGATAAFSAEEPAWLQGAAALRLKPNQTTTASLELTASSDGMYFVNVATTQAGRSSVVQIPVKVGAGAAQLQKQGTVQTTPSGEQVISLPAK
jgi:hypothetical protein